MLNVISLGAGVQSSVMALMAARGELTPMPDCAIFADTQWEPEGVYTHLDWLEGELPFPVYRVTAGNIRDDLIAASSPEKTRAASAPFFTEGGGMGHRQCTREYKVEPIRKKLRELIGLKFRQRGPKEVAIHQWIGISTDEAVRMKPSRDAWVQNIWPLIDAGMSRQDCLRWFEKEFPERTLAKSACIGCPYHSDAMWRDMKINDPRSFSDAVDFDKEIRRFGTIGSMERKQFLHRSCQPLDEVDFRNLEDRGQLNMFNNECEGMCGV